MHQCDYRPLACLQISTSLRLAWLTTAEAQNAKHITRKRDTSNSYTMLPLQNNSPPLC